jgi:N utilization substance protein B
VTTSRREERRQALVLLFQWDVTGQPLGSTFEGDAAPWARELAASVVARAAELDELITDASDEWTADRLGAVERNALRIAIHELLTRSVPREVAIDEAVHLAKRFGGGDDAGRLVNGILGRILRERVA